VVFVIRKWRIIPVLAKEYAVYALARDPDWRTTKKKTE
jgi:hypothetical protein